MPAERSHVADFHYGLEANVLLDPYLEVIGCRSLGVHLDCVEPTGKVQGNVPETTNVVDVADNARRCIDRKSPRLWRIINEVTARCAAAYTRSMVNPTMHAQNSLTLAKNV